MDSNTLQLVLSLRATVAFLGEKHQFGWWQSSFYMPASHAFLAPVFVKTSPLAQFTGATAAAARVHDERIGVGNVYHLFRLPEALEQTIFRQMHDPNVISHIAALTAGRDAAFALLEGDAAPATPDAVGPTWVGGVSALNEPARWAQVSALYLHGFRTGATVYPYFADRSL